MQGVITIRSKGEG